MNYSVKHPVETRLIVFDFSGASLPTRRNFLYSEPLSNTVSNGSMTATRDDGENNDLTLGASSTASPLVSATISGGTSGKIYTITCTATGTNGNAIIAMQGKIIVSDKLI